MDGSATTLTGGLFTPIVRRRRFPCVPSSVAAARRFVRFIWADVDDDVVLATSELAANAMEHAGTDFEVCLDRRGDARRVAVRDWSPDAWPRREVHHPPPGERGRGLHIVETLSERWGWTVANDSKQIWFDI